MSMPRHLRPLSQMINGSAASPTSYLHIPIFLAPALHASSTTATIPGSRCFTTTCRRPSYIGSAPISIPAEVTMQILRPSKRKTQPAAMRLVEIKGPLGSKQYPIPDYVRIEEDHENRKAMISVENSHVKEQRAMWGTTRANLANHVLGVSEGHSTILSLVGVGYRASVESGPSASPPSEFTFRASYPDQRFVSLKVGYSHPIELGVPAGVTASTPQPTRILLQGPDRAVLKQFAANIRKWRVPEPYKGKGIFVDGETIRLKAKKIK